MNVNTEGLQQTGNIQKQKGQIILNQKTLKKTSPVLESNSSDEQNQDKLMMTNDEKSLERERRSP